MMKIQSFAQFPVDHLSHPVVPNLVLLLCQFTAFASYVINCLISVSLSPTLNILLHLKSLRFDIIVPYIITISEFFTLAITGGFHWS